MATFAAFAAAARSAARVGLLDRPKVLHVATDAYVAGGRSTGRFRLPSVPILAAGRPVGVLSQRDRRAVAIRIDWKIGCLPRAARGETDCLRYLAHVPDIAEE